MNNVNEVTVTDTTGKSVVIQNDKVSPVFGLNSITPVKDPNTDAVAFHIKREDHTLGNMIQVFV